MRRPRRGHPLVSGGGGNDDRHHPDRQQAHGIYPSRDASAVYDSNRDAGTVSVLDARTLEQTALWTIPGRGSPDMGGVSVDGAELWQSGRYNSVVYVFDTRTGQVTHRILVGPGPAAAKRVDMTKNPPAGFDLRGLRNAVDTEVAQGRLGEDAHGPPDPELQAYETRLSSLHSRSL